MTLGGGREVEKEGGGGGGGASGQQTTEISLLLVSKRIAMHKAVLVRMLIHSAWLIRANHGNSRV